MNGQRFCRRSGIPLQGWRHLPDFDGASGRVLFPHERRRRIDMSWNVSAGASTLQVG